MDRKKTPDIMGELLTGKPEEHKTITPQEHNTITEERKSYGVMVKATFYLDKGVLDQLERRWIEERTKGRKLSKSKMVDLALRDYLSESE